MCIRDRVNGYQGNQTEAMRILTNGNVGIGTASPQEKFHLYGSPMIQHETRYSVGASVGWYKIGTWDAPDATGSRLKISLLGGEGYSAQSISRSGETIIYASINNNTPTTVSNMSGSIHAYGNPVISQAKFKQVGTDRSQYEIYAYVETFTQHSMKIECTNTTTFTRALTGSSDPGADSSTVQAALFTHVVDNSGNVGIGTASPSAPLHVAGGTIINSDGVAKKTYSYSGDLTSGQTIANSTIKLTFTNHTFSAKVVAHLVESDNEVSTLSFECCGGNWAGNAPSQTIALGPVTVFGPTSTNPWSSTVTRSTTTVSFKPTTNMAVAGHYNVFIEYISQSSSGVVSKITEGTTDVVTFGY